MPVSSITGVGIDELNNRVLVNATAPYARQPTNSVGSPAPSDAVQQSLVNTYGDSILEFRSGPMPSATADRYSDSPPWNGGDQIILPTVYGINGCTSGPGAHFSNGVHVLLTAGHCAYRGGVNFVGNITAYNGGNTVGLVANDMIGTTNPTSPWLDTAMHLS